MQIMIYNISLLKTFGITTLNYKLLCHFYQNFKRINFILQCNYTLQLVLSITARNLIYCFRLISLLFLLHYISANYLHFFACKCSEVHTRSHMFFDMHLRFLVSMTKQHKAFILWRLILKTHQNISCIIKLCELDIYIGILRNDKDNIFLVVKRLLITTNDQYEKKQFVLKTISEIAILCYTYKIFQILILILFI